tara:strand:- start:56 stop:658 length:603 start_codon:yes stop_codon:yes gene_type:complete
MYNEYREHYKQRIQEVKEDMINSGKYTKKFADDFAKRELTRMQKMWKMQDDEWDARVKHFNSLSNEELLETTNAINKEHDENLKSEFKRLKVGIKAKELDFFKKDLIEFREKYFSLVAFARGIFPLQAASVEKKYPKDVEKYKQCNTSFEHGFNSGCLATSRYFLDLILQNPLEDAKKYNYKDNKKETDEGESSFPFLDT